MASRDVTLTLVGGPTLLIETESFRLLTDPTFDGPGTYPSGSVTLEKLQGPALTAEEVGAVDAVLLSHDQHPDNLDRSGRQFLQDKTVFTTQAGARRLGDATGLQPWQTVTLEQNGHRLHVTATPARHGPPGIEPISGEVVGFLLGTDEPGDTLYLSGDTVWYEGVAEIARRFSPRIAALFTGAARPRGAFHMTMDSNDALEAANAFRDATIVSVHNEGWAHFTENESALARSFAALGVEARYKTLERGKPLRL